jgi:hypothetical protein
MSDEPPWPDDVMPPPSEEYQREHGWKDGKPPPNGKDHASADSDVLGLHFGFDATGSRPLGTVVEGLLHAGSVTLIYGPPKSGKSFLATDLALAVSAEQQDWMGHTIVRPGPVLYVACEGHSGFWKRLSAVAKVRGWDRATFPAGFILATGRPMLIRADARGLTYAPDPSAILAALDRVKQREMERPVAIVIDTVFRSFGAGNVNASPDMNVYLQAVAVLTDQGSAVALVHHEIKSGGTPAGSVSLIGGSDNIIHVWRETENSERRFWQVEAAKDDAETEPRAFTLRTVPIGLDADGRHASSCVIEDGGTAPEATKRRGRPPSDNSDKAVLAELVHRKLTNLMAAPGEREEVRIHPEAPPLRAIKRAELAVSLNQAGIMETPEGKDDEKRVAARNRVKLHRALNLLQKQGKVAVNDEWVALAR